MALEHNRVPAASNIALLPRLRAATATACAVMIALSAMVSSAAPAHAQTVYEITANWSAGTASSVHDGEVVSSRWRINLNDDAAAPANETIDNVTVTLTPVHGRIASVPDACLVSGVTPASSLSAGGVLTCNLGRQIQGTAVALEVPVVASGSAGDTLSVSGSVGGQTATTTPIPIQQGLDIDFKLSDPDGSTTGASTTSDTLEFPWSLSLGRGSLAGPTTLTYTISATVARGALLTTPGSYGCGAFTTTGDLGRSGHPWSGTADGNQTANTVGTCTLTSAGAGKFTLTLAGINWATTDAPTRDSAGNPLPLDRSVVASGVIFLSVDPAQSVATTSVTLTANIPTVAAPLDPTATSTDDASNNTATKVVYFFSGWSGIWGRGGQGTSWDDSLRKSAGSTVGTYMSADVPQTTTDVALSQCTVLDTRYVTLSPGQAVTVKPDGGTVDQMTGLFTLSYYTGTLAALDPASSSYNPNTVTDCSQATGWTTTLPSDLSTVRAVRVDYQSADVRQLLRIAVGVSVAIHSDVTTGQDIWEWNLYKEGATWSHKTAAVTNTPGARYASTTQSRDILRIVGLTPSVAKSVDQSTLRVGDAATYTLTYTASGGSGSVATVDGFQLVDTLPAGMSYVAGSASQVPVVTTSGGQTLLTWTLDGVTTNAAHTITYRASVDPSVSAGTVLKNSVVSSLPDASVIGGRISTPAATATLTVSSAGVTTIGKSADQKLIPNTDGTGTGSGSWTVALGTSDPAGQTFTDVIDILPYNGDGRGTAFHGTYAVTDVVARDGETVYYTTAPAAGLSDDPADPSNGSAADPTGNTVGWSTTKPSDASAITAVRLIGGSLASTATRAFQVVITTSGANGGDLWVNRAQARDSHTELVMRTSAPTAMSNYYAFDLKKYVQDASGIWHDAQDTNSPDWPVLTAGSKATYKIVVTNTGQGDLKDLTVTDALFPDVAYPIASLPSGSSDEHVFTEDLTGRSVGTVHNVATAHAPLPADSTQTSLPDSSDEANVVLVPAAHPGYTFSKTADPVSGTAVVDGDTITYVLIGTNTGDTMLDTVTITDDLADVLDNASLGGTPTSTHGADPTVVGTTLTWTGSLAVGQQVVITYAVIVSPGQGGQVVHNVASSIATPLVPDPLDPSGPGIPGTPITPPEVETRHPIPASPATPIERLAQTGSTVDLGLLVVSVGFLLVGAGAVVGGDRRRRR